MLALRVIERDFSPHRLVWTVAGLVHAVADALTGRFSACMVRGELSAFSRAPSGHCYFCLKDSDGQVALIRCAMFRRAAGLLDFLPADGQLVELRGRLTMYEPRGELQFVVESMRRAGPGALLEQFQRLKGRLEAEGLFDAARKREMPPYPRRIGIVTSPAAAALHDVVISLGRRAPHVEIILYPSAVQGPDAPAALVRALAVASRRAEVDTLILCRGGGSLEDLWAFNDERVVRAVASASMPVVCGVGHENDITLADFAADLRAPTPTAAAELATSSLAECAVALDGLETRLARLVSRCLEVQAQRLDAVALRLARPTLALRAQRHAIELLEQRLLGAARQAVPIRASRMAQLAGRLLRCGTVVRSSRAAGLLSMQVRLDAVDPQQVLRRGYAWLTDAQGRPVLSVAHVSVGRSLCVVMADGSADVTVTALHPLPPR